MYLKLINDGQATLLGPFEEIRYETAWQTFPAGEGFDFDPRDVLGPLGLEYDHLSFRWMHSDRQVKGPGGDKVRIGRVIACYSSKRSFVLVSDADNGFIMNREGATIDRL